MKTTIDIDEARLKRVMKIAGIKTRKAAIDYALREAEKATLIERIVRDASPDAEYLDALDPAYDLMKVREAERKRTDASD